MGCEIGDPEKQRDTEGDWERKRNGLYKTIKDGMREVHMYVYVDIHIHIYVDKRQTN